MTTSYRRLEFAREAERDIRGISRFTQRRWGARQRVRYSRQIAAAAEELTGFPEIDRQQDEISPGLRTRTIGQHANCYRITDEAIRVLRVLHVRMDAADQFASWRDET